MVEYFYYFNEYFKRIKNIIDKKKFSLKVYPNIYIYVEKKFFSFKK